MKPDFETRLEKIESWLMFEQGNFYWEMFTVLLRYAAYFFFGYLLLAIATNVMTVTLMEQLPLFCERI